MSEIILDELNNQIYYWPISNLAAGESSEAIRIKIPTPTTRYLTASVDARVKVWAKWMAFPANPYSNINDGTGINLAGIPGPYGEFEIYVEALEPMTEAFVRVPLSVITSEGVKAGWFN